MELKRIFDLLDRWRGTTRKDELLVYLNDAEPVVYSSQRLVDETDLLSLALLKMGIEPGEKVLVASANRPEWNVIDLAVAQIGAIPIVVYDSYTDKEFAFVLAHSDARVLFVENELLYSRLRPLSEQNGAVEYIFTIEPCAKARLWSVLLDEDLRKQESLWQEMQQRKNAIRPDDLFTIVYTSGTTGLPKGVMLSHRNLSSNIEATNFLFPVQADDSTMALLPVAHILARMTNYWYQYKRNTIYYLKHIDKLADGMLLAKPSTLVVVPKLVEALYDKLMERGLALKGFQAKVFKWAMELAEQFEHQHSWWYAQRLAFARKMVLSKIKEVLGGQIRVIISGGAALSPQLERSFQAAGICLIEGYGLSETSPVVCVMAPIAGEVKFGTVGRPLSNVSVKLAEDREILVSGANVMLGYYKDPEKTAQTIDADGWLHTGDLGRLDADGFLIIEDRKKEVFKLSNGRYVTPQQIENFLKTSLFVERAMVVGENQEYVAALLVPNFSYLYEWSIQQHIEFKNSTDLLKHELVKLRYQTEVERVNKLLPDFRQVKQFSLMDHAWTIEGGELSPSLKPKRNIIRAKYEIEIKQLFARK